MAVKNATTSLLMLQLLLADALLASLAERRLPPPLLPAGGRLHPHYNLNRVLDLASRINRTLAAGTFVEDVSHLAEGRDKCENKFFCKVHQILQNHTVRVSDSRDLVRNLHMFLTWKQPNCSVLLKDVKPEDVSRPLQSLIGYLTHCIQHSNFNRTSTRH